jgi:hypothetical protein
MITSVEEMIEKYVSAWNGKGLEEFKTAFTEIWEHNANYTDPNFALVKGLTGLIELANASLEREPIRKFSILTMPDYHHNVVRYTWKVDLPNETKDGFDYIEFNEAYKITRLVSFMGPLKSVE